jgi:hypothetical protein
VSNGVFNGEVRELVGIEELHPLDRLLIIWHLGIFELQNENEQARGSRDTVTILNAEGMVASFVAPRKEARMTRVT